MYIWKSVLIGMAVPCVNTFHVARGEPLIFLHIIAHDSILILNCIIDSNWLDRILTSSWNNNLTNDLY